MAREGRIDHDRLFFTNSGRPISDLKYSYTCWQRTLRRLVIRYRKPYMARHTSVSWNLVIERNPLLVAKEHGHRVTTMLSVYAAWTEGAVETDITAIREAMNCVNGRGAQDKTAGDQPGTEVPASTMPGLTASGSDRRPRACRPELARDDFPAGRRFGSGFGSSPAAPKW